MEKSIFRLYIVHFFTGLVFYYGIERLFLLSIGVDGFGISMNAVTFAAVVILFDIPLGTVADTWGRKNTLIIATFCLLTATIIYGQSQNLNEYLVGTIVYAFYVVGTSGTYQAIVYDTLHELGRSSEFNKIFGRMYACFQAGIGLALFMSGFIAQTFGFRVNYRLAIISNLIALLILISVREPVFHKPDKEKRMFWRYAKESVRHVMNNKILVNTSLLFLVLGFLRWMSDEYSQLIFSSLKIKLILVGIISGSAFLAAILGRLLAYKFSNNMKQIAIINVMIFCLVGIAPPPIVIASLIVFYGFNNLLQNNNESIIQHSLPSHIRATATSVYSFMSSVIVIVTGLAIGLILRDYSIFVVFRGAAIVAIVFTIIWYRKVKADELLKFTKMEVIK